MLEATTFKIIEKRRELPFALTHLSDFGLEEVGQVPASEILGNEQIEVEFFAKTIKQI